MEYIKAASRYTKKASFRMSIILGYDLFAVDLLEWQTLVKEIMAVNFSSRLIAPMS